MLAIYLAEHDRDEAKTREREAAKTSLYQEAAKLNRAETERKRKADEEPSASLNPNLQWQDINCLGSAHNSVKYFQNRRVVIGGYMQGTGYM